MSTETSQEDMRGSSVDGDQALNSASAYCTDMEISEVESDQPNEGCPAGHNESVQIRDRATWGDRPEMIQYQLQHRQALNDVGWHKRQAGMSFSNHVTRENRTRYEW